MNNPSKLSSNAANLILVMTDKMVDHYEKVIRSCDTAEQLDATTKWANNGFERLIAASRCLPRRKRNLCLSMVCAGLSFIYGVSHSTEEELEVGFEVFATDQPQS